ncbi:MAG TPA: hypothetical protein DCS93_16375 [Microscillaceae bacterium]|nr:hypothetical protein [Microscillaceae bacterium]
MRTYFFIGILAIVCHSALAQNQITFLVIDQQTKEALIGVNVYIPNLKIGAVSDASGKAQITNIPHGRYRVEISYIGYQTWTKQITFPNSQSQIRVMLEADASGLDEITVKANRSNRSISRIPSRIEVLTDEVEEAATMDPSKIAHLLMHTTGVQVQQTSATSGASSVRIQGQYGRYTQILKDGFPIYGGFTGGLGVLQIPPLDLKQVEFIKGSSSTLYGGGAIAGLINLVSKEPSEDEQLSLHLNFSHIGNTDLNSFYSKKNSKWGITVFASNNTNRVYDVDQDGFSDVPQVRKFNFNPKLFYYLDKYTTISLGATFTNENRIGGDVNVVEGYVPDTLHNFFERNKSQQTTTQFRIDRKLNSQSTLVLKNSSNRFKRNIYLNDYAFAGIQFSTFSELSYSWEDDRHSLILGSNVYTDQFEENAIATPVLRNQKLWAMGFFAQHIWDIFPQLAIETGFRLDYNETYGTFPLPRLAIIYKPTPKFTARFSGGLGYKLPSIFTEDAERLAYENIVPINSTINKVEKSYGVNADFTYYLVSNDELSISLTEFVFYNRLDQPMLLQSRGNNAYQLININGYFETQGIESLLKAFMGHFHLYFGYTYVQAICRKENGSDFTLPLTPTHSFHGDLMFVEEGKWRIGIDAEYESEQTLASGRRVKALFKAGFLAERTLGKFSVYVNLENWTDTRQTRYESLVQAPYNNPRFTEVWAPLDGFIFNAGFKLKL